MTSSIEIPSIALAGEVSIPQFGLGVFQVPPEETTENVLHAIEAGYRHIDTAKAYGNEAQVGQAIRASGLDRSEFFITTKCFNDDHGHDSATRALKASLGRLELDYVDLYLIHWPVPSQDRYVETWRAFVDAQEAGLARAIGVSNFQPEHLRRIIDETGVTPAVNQIELHPYLQQAGLRREHADHGIVTESWSPLAQGLVLDDPAIASIADRHGKSAGPGRAALAHRARQRRLPEVGHGRAPAGEHRHLRLRARSRRAGRDRGARPRRAHRPRPGRVRPALIATNSVAHPRRD